VVVVVVEIGGHAAVVAPYKLAANDLHPRMAARL
jgi:hypothetical protein